MGQYEPDDSRIVTQKPSNTPVEPDRTGPEEDPERQRTKKEKPDPYTGNLREPGHESIPNRAATHMDKLVPRSAERVVPKKNTDVDKAEKRRWQNR